MMILVLMFDNLYISNDYLHYGDKDILAVLEYDERLDQSLEIAMSG